VKAAPSFLKVLSSKGLPQNGLSRKNCKKWQGLPQENIFILRQPLCALT
jgi:hypothetical protein